MPLQEKLKNKAKKKKEGREEKERKNLFLALKFFLFFLILNLSADILARFELLYSLKRITTEISLFFIKAISLPASLHPLDDSLICLPERNLAITLECTGIFLITTFISLMLATPSKNTKEKIFFILSGSFLIYAINILRIVLAALVSFYLSSYFDLIHNYVFTTLLVLFVAALWIIWLSKVETT